MITPRLNASAGKCARLPGDFRYHRRRGRFFSGERTRLACWFRRLAETIFTTEKKFAMARAPSPAREARALPRTPLLVIPSEVACHAVALCEGWKEFLTILLGKVSR